MIVYVYVCEYFSIATLYDFSSRKVLVKMLQWGKMVGLGYIYYYCGLLNTVWVL